MKNQKQYSQPGQDVNQGYNRPRYILGPMYRQSTNLYQQANRNQYNIQQIPMYQGQQQQQSAYLTVDCKPAISPYPTKLAKDLTSSHTYSSTINQPPITVSRKNTNTTTHTMDPMTISRSSIMTTSTPTILRSALLSTVKSASNHSRQTTPYTGTTSQHVKLQNGLKTQRKLSQRL